MSPTDNQMPQPETDPSMSVDSEATPAQPLTRSLFILPDYEKIATSSLETMVVLAGDGEHIKQVPLPPSVKSSGVVPEGYCVDFLVDPDTVIAGLAVQGITDVSHLQPGALDEIIEILNSPQNLAICPKSVHDGKNAFFSSAVEKRMARLSKKRGSSTTGSKAKKGKWHVRKRS